MSSRQEMEAAFEALLFVASEPVPRTGFLKLFPDIEEIAAEEALAAVLARFDDPAGRGVMVDEVAGGVRLVTRPEFHGYLAAYFESAAASRISVAALETLAIVAYRQPVTAPEIQELRGVSSTSVLHTLLDNRLIRVAGRKDVVGRPFVYRTTREFLLRFGLNQLRDLPPLEEFEELLSGADDDPRMDGSAAQGLGSEKDRPSPEAVSAGESSSINFDENASDDE